MTAHPRHKATHAREERHETPAEALQGAYGSGGSYGVGGGFADDEPGTKAEDGQTRDTLPDLDPPDAAPDVHTRESEISDAHLRELKRAEQERGAAARKRSR